MSWKHSPSTDTLRLTLAEKGLHRRMGLLLSATARAMRRPPSTKAARERSGKCARPPHAGHVRADSPNGAGRAVRDIRRFRREFRRSAAKLRYHAPTLVAEAWQSAGLRRRDWMCWTRVCGTGLSGVGSAPCAPSRRVDCHRDGQTGGRTWALTTAHRAELLRFSVRRPRAST